MEKRSDDKASAWELYMRNLIASQPENQREYLEAQLERDLGDPALREASKTSTRAKVAMV